MAKRKKRSKAQKGTLPRRSEAELARRHQRFMAIAFAVVSLFKYSCILAGVVSIVFFGVYLPIKEAVGKTTVVSYGVDFLAQFRAELVISVSIIGGLYWWGRSWRKKCLDERSEKDSRNKAMEKKIDPDRSSSRLTTDGNRLPEGDSDE